MRLLLFFFIPFYVKGGLPSNCVIRNLDTIPHKINVESLRFHPAGAKSYYATFLPSEYVKITFKAGISSAVGNKVLSLIEGESEPLDPTQIFAYDLRVKFYTHKKLRILLRTQNVGGSGQYYFGGLIWKFK